jgi:1-deoxy-D-xylulose-5-phosphate synthase
MLQPQGMFEDLGLKYFGPVDGHDIAAVEYALRLARGFGGPVIVHCVTRKGYGYAPAENDEADQMHQSGGFDPATGLARPTTGKSWTKVFGEELVALGDERADIVAITAAMCDPTGLGPFRRQFPDRCYDVGIAEQHAVTSAAGLAFGGLHPVVCIYATFVNRAFDQLLMDVALHRLPVTFVLDRAGVTGQDGPSHNGMWDLAILGIVPGLRIATPRDEATLRELLREAVAVADGPTVVRYPKTPIGSDLPAIRRVADVDVLREAASDSRVDVLIVAVGSIAGDAVQAAAAVERAGYTTRVVAPRWVSPIDTALLQFAKQADLVVTVEDGVVAGGVGARLAQTLRLAGHDVPTREIGIPVRFLEHGSVADVRAVIGLTVQDIGRQIVEWSATVSTGGGADDGGADVPAADRAGELKAD